MTRRSLMNEGATWLPVGLKVTDGRSHLSFLSERVTHPSWLRAAAVSANKTFWLAGDNKAMAKL